MNTLEWLRGGEFVLGLCEARLINVMQHLHFEEKLMRLAHIWE